MWPFVIAAAWPPPFGLLRGPLVCAVRCCSGELRPLSFPGCTRAATAVRTWGAASQKLGAVWVPPSLVRLPHAPRSPQAGRLVVARVRGCRGEEGRRDHPTGGALDEPGGLRHHPRLRGPGHRCAPNHAVHTPVSTPVAGSAAEILCLCLSIVMSQEMYIVNDETMLAAGWLGLMAIAVNGISGVPQPPNTLPICTKCRHGGSTVWYCSQARSPRCWTSALPRSRRI